MIEDRARKIRTVNFVFVTAMLVLMAVGLGVLFSATINGAVREAEPKTHKLLVYLAWLSAALLALTLFLLTWIVARHLIGRVRPPERHEPTPYVDAWALAGKRLKLDDKPKEDEECGPDEDQERS